MHTQILRKPYLVLRIRTQVPFILRNLNSLFVSENPESVSRGIANGVCKYARNNAISFKDGIYPPLANLVCTVPQFMTSDSSDILDIVARVQYSSSDVASFNWGTDVNLLKSYIRDELASMFPSVNFDSMVLEYTNENTNEKSSSSSGLSTAGGIGVSVSVVVILIVLVFISYFAYNRGYCSSQQKHPGVTRRMPSGMVELSEDDNKSMQVEDSKKIRATDIVPDVEDNTSSTAVDSNAVDSNTVDSTPMGVGTALKVQNSAAL